MSTADDDDIFGHDDTTYDFGLSDDDMGGDPDPVGQSAAAPTRSSMAASPAPATRRRGSMLQDDEDMGDFGAPEADDRPAAPAKAAQPSQPVALKGVVSRVLYKGNDPERPLYILAIRPNKDQELPEGTRRPVMVVSSPAFEPNEGDLLEGIGQWVDSRRNPGEKQFQVTSIRIVVPKTNQGIRKFLQKDVAGVGEAAFNKLTRHFGERLFAVIDDPEMLAESGISALQAENIAKAWKANEYYNELSVKLLEYGLNRTVVHTIIETYGAGIEAVIKEDPWQLVNVEGVAFPTADGIALKAGHARNSPARITAGIEWCLVRETEDAGHCALPKQVLVTKASRLLEVKGFEVNDVLNTMLADGTGNMVADPTSNLIFPEGIHEAETRVAERLAEMAASPPLLERTEAEAVVRKAQLQVGKILDESQFPAAVSAIMHKVCVVTGGPGTGKSTTLEVVVRSLENMGRRFVLACPTGKGAKRMKEASGYPAMTIHSQLGYDPRNGEFRHNKKNPIACFDGENAFIPANHFINDEQSMEDIELIDSQLDAMAPDAAFIMTGDADQLQSVGRGAVLNDIIASGIVPVARLTKPHRSGAGSGIAVAASRINNRIMPLEDGETLEGFNFIEASDDAILSVVDTLVAETLPMQGVSVRDDLVVLTAIREGQLGVYNINDVIKHISNPAFDDGESYQATGKGDRKVWYSQDDVIMQVKNSRVMGTMNGETGIVLNIEKTGTGKSQDVMMEIDFDNLGRIYNNKSLKDTQLAYSGTVHKWQGSEKPIVIVTVPNSHQRALSKQSLYTALTRAKLECYFVGSKAALQRAINRDDDVRHTGLQAKLKEAYQQRLESSRELSSGLSAASEPNGNF